MTYFCHIYSKARGVVQIDVLLSNLENFPKTDVSKIDFNDPDVATAEPMRKDLSAQPHHPLQSPSSPYYYICFFSSPECLATF